MSNSKKAILVSKLLSAISSAVTYNDKKQQVALVNCGMDWANASDDAAEQEAWEKIEIAAGWIGGFSNE